MVCEDEKSPFFDNAINGPSNNDSSFVSAIASNLKSKTCPFSGRKPTVKDIIAFNRQSHTVNKTSNDVSELRNFNPDTDSAEVQSVNEVVNDHTFGTPQKDEEIKEVQVPQTVSNIKSAHLSIDTMQSDRDK